MFVIIKHTISFEKPKAFSMDPRIDEIISLGQLMLSKAVAAILYTDDSAFD